VREWIPSSNEVKGKTKANSSSLATASPGLLWCARRARRAPFSLFLYPNPKRSTFGLLIHVRAVSLGGRDLKDLQPTCRYFTLGGKVGINNGVKRGKFCA
jgi:hypothetical protein